MITYFAEKGSISAGNPLNVNVTMVINRTAWGNEPSTIFMKLTGAFPEPRLFDANNLAPYIEIPLSKQRNDVWTAYNAKAKYDQGGSLPILANIDGEDVATVSSVQIGSQDVTIATRTNSLILSLTWAILAFTVLELRVEDK